MGTGWLDTLQELVVPVDGRDPSTRAVPVAGRLANRLGLGIRLITVSADPAAAEDWLAGLARQHLPDFDVALSTVEADDPVDGIVAGAGASGLVCMATSASLLPHSGRIGSVAEGVVRALDRPVFLVGPDMEPSPGEHTARVILPVDGSNVSELAVPTAAGLAQALGVPLWVVSVIDPDEMADQVKVNPGAVAGEASYVHNLAAEIGAQSRIKAEFEVLHEDDPARAIVDFAGADGTIVMSTHGRSGLRRVFAGSVATDVVAHSRRAVLVSRPDTGD